MQVAANPIVTLLGKPQTASSRLTLTQAFNSLGTTLAPIIGGILIFSVIDEHDMSANSVILPYVILAAVLFLLAMTFLKITLPDTSPSEVVGSVVSKKGSPLQLSLTIGNGKALRLITVKKPRVKVMGCSPLRYYLRLAMKRKTQRAA